MWRGKRRTRRARHEQPSDRFAPVPISATELVEQFRLRASSLSPRALPLGQDMEHLLLVEREPWHKPAADAEGMHVAVLAFNRRRHVQSQSKPATRGSKWT